MATLYFNATVSGDGDYGNTANWWTNVGATVPAGVLPVATDNIIVQTPIFGDSSYVTTPGDGGQSWVIGVNTAVFNNNTYLATNINPNYGYGLACNLATFNGNSYTDPVSSPLISNNNGLAGNAIFNNTSYCGYGVSGTAKFNYLTATLNGGIWQITDVTGYGVGWADGGAYDSANHLIQIVNFINTDFHGYMENERGTQGDIDIRFYNSTANYSYIFGSASFHDYSQNFGTLDYLPFVVYPNPNVVVGGQYNTNSNRGAVYIGYGVYFSDYGPGGQFNGEWNEYTNWFGNDGISGNAIPTAANDDQVTFFDCWPTQDSSGSASLLALYLHGPTQFAIPIAIFGDAYFYNTSFFTSTGSTGGNAQQVYFYDSSYNAGTLTNGTVQFFNNSYNNGTISYPGTGYNISLTFRDNSHNAGIVTGTSAFYGNSYNSGQVGTAGGTTASFHDASQNQGVIGGDPLTAGALAYWNLNNNGSGGVSLLDSTGNGNTLTNNGGVALGTGIIGGDAVFNGTNTLGIPTLSNQTTGEWSISQWVKFVNPATGTYQVFCGTIPSLAMQCYLDPSGVIALALYGGSPTGYSTSATISDSNWHNVIITGKVNGGTVAVYLDGTQVFFNSTSGDVVNIRNTSGSLFGSENDGAYFINGQMDEIGIWNRALSQSEVTALYNSGAGRTYPFTGYVGAISNGDFNDTSINIGLVTGNARFRYVTATSGVAVDITGYANGPVNGLTYDSANNVITTWKFQGTDFMQSGATVTGNAIFVQNTGASGIPVCLITGNANVYYPAQTPLQATVLGTITYHGATSKPTVNIFVMLNFPFPLNYILGKTNPFGVSSLLKLPFYINK